MHVAICTAVLVSTSAFHRCTVSPDGTQDSLFFFTGAVMGQYGAVLGFVGLAFSAADCFAESLRGAPPQRRCPTCSADAQTQDSRSSNRAGALRILCGLYAHGLMKS